MADRSERLDHQAASNPALRAAAGRGEAKLLGHRRLYELWGRRPRAVWRQRLKVIGRLPAVA